MIPGYLHFLDPYYDIIEDLTPGRQSGQKTFLAFFATDSECSRVVLKELDKNQTILYEKLYDNWNPNIANILHIHPVPGDIDQVSDDIDHVPGDIDYMPDNIGSEVPTSIAAIEYAGDHSLSAYIAKHGPLSETQALNITIQLCNALSPIHELGIIHRDIKPDNVIISDLEPFSIKLTDFGAAKQSFSKSSSSPDSEHPYADTTVVGTIGYQAPESLSERTTERADIYSVGCLLNYMLTGSDPGISRYKGKASVRYLIRKSINEDPSMRFHDISELKRNCESQLRKTPISRIPLLRNIPGFRSGSPLRASIASFYYLLMFYELTMLFVHHPIQYFIITVLFWLIIPLLILGNAGYVCEHLPDQLLFNNMAFHTVRIASFFICFFVPLISSL